MDTKPQAEEATPTPAKLATLQQILGADAVFVPIEKGKKGPRRQGWQNLCAKDMADEDFLKRFEEDVNVGVLTGHPSGGLVAIDIDTYGGEELSLFLELNPALQNTATVVGEKGAKIFVRADRSASSGKIRNELGEDVGDFLADGKQAVVHGLHPEGMDYRWICECPPIEICMDNLVLPDGWMAPWVPPLESLMSDTYGMPFERGKTVLVGKLNESFWAGLTYAAGVLLYEAGEQGFYSYEAETGLWISKSEDAMKRQVAHHIYGFAAQQQSHEVQEGIRQKVNDSFLRGCVNRLKSIAEKVDPFKRPSPNLIHLANGMFDLEKDELLPFSPEYYSRNQIPIPYDAKASCPRFVNELLAGMMTPDDASLFQRIFGGFLLPENLPQVITMIYGEACAGKSTLTNVCLGILGNKYVGNLRLKYVDSRFELGRLLSARLLTAPDIPPDFLDDGNASALKAMTGGDTLEAELKGSNASFKVPGTFHVVITGNSRPIIRIQNDRDAWKRRLVPFEITRLAKAKSIPNFDRVLVEEEGAGILLWAIRGAQLLRSEIDTHGRLQLNKVQETRINDLLYESDSLRYFLERYVTKEQTGSATTEGIQSRYSEMCRAKKWTPVKDSTFRSQLPDLMQEIHYTSPSHSIKSDAGDQRGYRGIRIHPLQGDLL